MVRSALGANATLGRSPKRLARYWPAASVAVGSSLSVLPIVTEVGWGPDFGFLMLIAWRLLRGDVIPAWWAAPLGLLNDLITGSPVGLSIFVWTASMLLLDLGDRRTMWRDYWIEWLLAAVLLFIGQLVRWRVDTLMGAPYEFHLIWSPWIIAVLTFPLAAFAASAVDRWRLGR